MKRPDHNQTDIDYHAPMPRPNVRGRVIDAHIHLIARRHGADFFQTADHYGIDQFISMTPLEEAVGLHRQWSHRVQFIAIPTWHDDSPWRIDNWLRRIEAFYNLGSRIAKFHAAPRSLQRMGAYLDDPAFRPLFRELIDRNMIIMTHIGDPDTWYANQYADRSKFGSRDDHYKMWENLLVEYRGHPWLGAHLGGNPENLDRLQSLLDRFPDLMLDNSATRWLVREVSKQRDPAREFMIRNQDRILFGSDQVTGDDRGFDFLASRFWCHRKLWETAYIGQSPILDPDCPPDAQPTLRGLALPDEVLQKMYHDNAVALYRRVGVNLDTPAQSQRAA